MTEFVLAAIGLTLLALAFVIIPVWRSRRLVDTDSLQAPETATSNLAIARAQRDELEREYAAGLINGEERDRALNELAGRLSRDLEDPSDAPSARTAPPPQWAKAVVAVLLVLMPASAGLLYWKLGTPDALRPPPPQSAAPSQEQIVSMVDSLAEKMKSRPDDAQGWALLARSQAALGRFDAAAKAYERLDQLQPNDADVLADFAEVVAMAQQESFEGKPWELIRRALAVNPDQRKALAMAGTTELKRRKLPEALAHWERLLRLLPPDSDDAKQVGNAIMEVRLAMGGAGTPGSVPAKAAAPVATAPKATASSEVKVAGKVALSPAMAKLAVPGDAVFIFARAAGPSAPRMPLAVLRVSVSDLPKSFELTDAMAMAPGMKLSDFPEVMIEARVSKSGNAQSQPGDLTGVAGPIKPGGAPVSLLIDRQVK